MLQEPMADMKVREITKLELIFERLEKELLIYREHLELTRYKINIIYNIPDEDDRKGHPIGTNADNSMVDKLLNAIDDLAYLNTQLSLTNNHLSKII